MSLDRSLLSAQQEFLRRAVDTGHGGVPIKVLASRSTIPEATLRSWGKHDAPAMMPLSALWRLCGHVDPELLNLLLPDGFALVRVPEGIDHAEFAGAVMDYAASYAAARHPDSEDGSNIGPGEEAGLTSKAVKLTSVGMG